MKYTVVTSEVADYQLAKIWLDVTDQQSMADAFDRIESLLRRNPSQCGAEHPSGWRGLILPLLAITFRVSDDDRLVKILSVFYRT